MPRKHRDASGILQRLHREKITRLYHFTSIENIPGIREREAIYSKQALEAEGLWPCQEPGGNDLSHRLDRSNDNWDKVSLNYTPWTPMAYLKKQQMHLCFFSLDAAIAAFEGVVFTDTNAARAGDQSPASGLEGLDLVDFAAVRSFPRPWDRDGWHKPVQAEVLVPDCISLEFVSRVCFLSNASLEEAERMWGATAHPPCQVDQQLFSDTPQVARPTVTFPHLSAFILTDAAVDKLNVHLIGGSQHRFERARGRRITAVASVRAAAGIQGMFTWNPGGRIETAEFETAGEFYHWSAIDSSDLREGRCSIEYKLANIRWATVRFEVF